MFWSRVRVPAPSPLLHPYSSHNRAENYQPANPNKRQIQDNFKILAIVSVLQSPEEMILS
jgi:hypothetical protein